MKNFTKANLIAAAITFLTISSARVMAQWNMNTSLNLEISGLPTADMISVPTTDGKMWIAFYHENAGNYDMRAQLLDAEGNKLLGPDGVLVSNQPSGTATFVFNACADASNNLIIGMQDERSGTMQAVLYKISQVGTHLWSTTGVILGNGLAPWPCALPNGEVVVCWNGDATLDLQKISTSGALAWATPIAITVGASTTTRGQIVANLNNKFTMVYQKNVAGISTNLYAQMFNSSGTALYAPLQIGNQTTAPYRYYSIGAEADTTYYGYYSSTGLRFNSFMQRINPNGTIPYGMNGSAFNTFTGGSDYYQMETSISLEPGSPYIWAVCSFTDPNQTLYGVYIQKYLKSTGTRQFGNQAKMVYAVTAARDIQAGDIALADDTPMFMSYDNDYKIYATRLDAAGNFAWPYDRAEISSTTSAVGKGRYGFGHVGPDMCAGIWAESRGSGTLGYAQNITVGGLFGMDVATQGGVPATITIGGGTLQMTSTIYPSYASQSVTWNIVPGTGLASISQAGLVTAIIDGNVWAKAVSVQDNTVMDSLMITISGQIPIPPSVVTLPATNITFSEAVLHGTVNANNFSSAVSFEWGSTVSYGNTIASTPVQVTGNTVTPVQAGLSGLTPGATYHFRCVATNTGGTTYGLDQAFTTQCLLAGSIGSITGTSSLCAGSTSIIYSVAPFAGATGYVWTIPTGATITAGNNTNSITVDFATNAQSGNLIVYATDGICNSYASAPLAVTVIPLPVQAGAINGVTIVCDGAQGIPYSVAAIPGVSTYIWTVPAGAEIAIGLNTNAITVNFNLGSSTGNITVYGTNSCGSGAPSNPLTVNVVEIPGDAGAITGPAEICAEASNIVYSITPVSNAYGYVWELPQGATITAGANTNQISVHYASGATSGSITVYATNGNCYGEEAPPLPVTVNATPPTPVITWNGDTLVSSADNGNQWYIDGVEIPGATGNTYLPLTGGTYTVIVTLNNCSSASSYSIVFIPEDIRTIDLNSALEVYPNPNNGQFNIQIESIKNAQYNLELFNSIGALIWERINLQIDGVYAMPVDLKNTLAGVYMLVVRSGDNYVMRKVSIR
jgi:hypothetical protein